MYHLVYLTTNLINNKIYVGVHSTYNLNDNYIGSGRRIKLAIKKYGKFNFERKILYYCLEAKDAYEIENQIVDKNFIERKNTYNYSLGGQGGVRSTSGDGWMKNKSIEELQIRKNKISLAYQNLSSDKKLERKIRGKELNIYLDKIGRIGHMKGKHHSEESKRKISNSNKGRKCSDTQRIKAKDRMMGNSHSKGRKCSEAEIEQRRLRMSENNPSCKHLFLITNPEGNIFKIKNLKKFCLENNLNPDTMSYYTDKGIIQLKYFKNNKYKESTINCQNWIINKLY